MAWNDEADVVIVGGGGSGLAAAVEAASCGAQVVVLEKNAALGGTTALAIGSFTAAGTSMQRQAGIDDSPQAHDEDVAKFAPHMEARKQMGVKVLLFLIVFAGLMYAVKRKVWADLH